MFREWAQSLKGRGLVLRLALRHPEMPWYAKACGALTLLYALSPIDLIPDFIPVLGHLDDVVLVPLGLWCTIRLVPKKVWAECEAEAERSAAAAPAQDGRGALLVVALWLLLAALGGWAGYWIWLLAFGFWRVALGFLALGSQPSWRLAFPFAVVSIGFARRAERPFSLYARRGLFYAFCVFFLIVFPATFCAGRAVRAWRLLLTGTAPPPKARRRARSGRARLGCAG